MSQDLPNITRPQFIKALLCGVVIAFCVTVLLKGRVPQNGGDEIPDITNEYQFLSAEDTLALLEEDEKLKGYIDVHQSDEESDAILTYNLVSGSRKGSHVEFKTSKIHQKYYRFTGVVQRGQGHEEKDPDYLRLVGDLEIVMARGAGQNEAVQRMHVAFKSMGKPAKDEEGN
jgi:hypothetical protein